MCNLLGCVSAMIALFSAPVAGDSYRPSGTRIKEWHQCKGILPSESDQSPIGFRRNEWFPDDSALLYLALVRFVGGHV